MELFNFLKTKGQNQSPAMEDFLKAKEQFEKNEFQDSLNTLSGGFRKDIDCMPLYELAIKCLEKLGAEDEAELFRKALEHREKFESFNNLGTHFYDVGYYDLATPFLEKAVSIDPTHTDTIHDLSIVYARRFQISKAVKILEENHPKKDFWNYWFWCKLRILEGKPQGVREGLNELMSVLDKEPNQDDVIVARQKVEEVLELLSRYELIKDPEIHIRDWHFIQYGDVILDFFEESDDYVAGGRYVASWGSYESIKQIVLKLKQYLEALEVVIENVVFLPDRDSKILGLLTGMELGVKAQAYDPQQTNKNTLIVGANSYDFDSYEELVDVKEGQVVFSLNHDWLKPSWISPDIAGFMTQYYYFPWNGGGIRVIDQEKGLTEKTEPDKRSEPEIATDIFNKKVELQINPDHIDFYTKNKDYLKLRGSKVTNQRFNFMMESPVGGSYFF